MQKYDLIVFNDQPHRILSLKDDCAIIINCDSLKMPYKIKNELLVNCLKVDKLSKEFPEITSLSAQKQKVAHQRYTIIAPILPFVDDDYMRSKLISQVSITTNFSKQTIRKYLCRYLAYQNISCLVPCEKDKNKELSLDEKNFRWAINKYFYSPMKHTLKNSYLFMLKEKYTDPTGELMDGYPPFHRFRYFYNKTKKLQNYYISREGLSSYQRNHRPLLGEGVRELATSVGTGMFDSTILDVYLINESGELVGRPILTACIDAFSGLCCGYSLTWEGGLSSLKSLINNIVCDKVEWCKSFGVNINKEDWDCRELPAVFITDKGKEYTSYLFEQLTELGVNIINLPPYRPDLKSSVEQFFNVIQNLYKPSLKGKGVVEDDYLERGVCDYRKSACLTLKEMETIIIKCIIYYNTKRIVNSFTNEMLNSSLSPYSNVIWNHYKQEMGANLISVHPETIRLTLLPRTTAKFNRKGLLCNKLRYYADGFTERFLKGDKCVTSYDPNDTSRIWLYENGNYIEFTLIDTMYNGFSFEDINVQVRKINEHLKSFEEETLEAKISLFNDLEVIGSRGISYTPKLKEMRKTRNQERNKANNGYQG